MRVLLRAAAGALLAGAPALGWAQAPSACDRPSATAMQVGPGKAFIAPSVAAAVAKDGAVVHIAAGDYRGDVAVWTARNLTICGTGGKVRLFADGKSAQGKAIWVVTGGSTLIENIEFHGAKVADRNGAGIRAEHQGELTIRRCGFFDNENGILGGGPGATITIDASEFARNGAGDGQSHNLYVGRIDLLKVSDSMFREARVGHNLKSRAKVSRVERSYLMDGPVGNSSYLADFPDGGAVLLRGNLFHKGPKAENPNAIAFAAEGNPWPGSTLELVHNTIVTTRPGGAFVMARPGTSAVRMTANLLAGTRSTLAVTGGIEASRVTQSRTLMADAADVPGAADLTAPNFWPSERMRDQMLLPDAPDETYRHDAPKPMVRRFVPGALRLIGALQSHP